MRRGSRTAGSASTSACTSCRSTTACSTGSIEIPQTLCHNDFHPDNVLDSGLLIDWAFCGVGPVGMDAGVLVGDGAADEKYPADRVDEVFDAVWRAYTEGYGSAGDDVRYGYVQGIRRLRWLDRDRSPAWSATIDFIDGLGSDG